MFLAEFLHCVLKHRPCSAILWFPKTPTIVLANLKQQWSKFPAGFFFAKPTDELLYVSKKSVNTPKINKKGLKKINAYSYCSEITMLLPYPAQASQKQINKNLSITVKDLPILVPSHFLTIVCSIY